MKYDALVIGAGQAGIPLAVALAGDGQKVALAEGAEIGGSCVNFGCTPSKTIVASARAAYLARRSEDFGIITGEVKVDFARVIERWHKIVADSRQSSTDQLNQAGVALLRDYATFIDEHHLTVGKETVEADRIYLDTGSRPHSPRIPGLDTVNALNYKTFLDLKELPHHLIIIGGGYIGCEYAQAYRRFGSAVTVLEQGDQILSREDEDIADEIHEVMETDGVRVVLQVKITNIAQHGKQIRLSVDHHGTTEVVEGTHLLVATGRKPNSDQLGLDKIGVKIDNRGYIQTDEYLQTSVPHIWAMGDVNGRGAFTHTAHNDYEIVWDHYKGGKRKVTDRIEIYGVFIDPPLGRVGLTENDVRKSGQKALIATMPMSDVSRAVERDETKGFVKVLVDARSKQFLGAAMIGLNGDELIHIFADLMYARAPYTVVQNAVHAHPTVAELLPTLMHKLHPMG